MSPSSGPLPSLSCLGASEGGCRRRKAKSHPPWHSLLITGSSLGDACVQSLSFVLSPGREGILTFVTGTWVGWPALQAPRSSTLHQVPRQAQ